MADRSVRKGSTAAGADGGKDARKKGPSINENPKLRQHPKHFYDNFVTKGIGHEMSQQRRGREESPEHDAAASEREINRRKRYDLPGDPNATNPPFHIAGDNERVRDAGTFCRIQARLRAALTAADGNADGLVTLKEFSRAVQEAADRFLSQAAITQQFRLLDAEGTGKVSVEEAVAASVRTLSTRPSQRQSLGVGNVLAWDDAADARDPASCRAARTGGAADPHRYYSLNGSERVATSPAREALLPGLSARVAGVATSSRLKEIDEHGGTTAPLLRGSSSLVASPSPRKHTNGHGSTRLHSPRQASPRQHADRPRSYAAGASKGSANRTTTLRAQYLQQEEQLQAALEASYFPRAAAQSPRFATPRGANLAPRPGVHIAGVRPATVES